MNKKSDEVVRLTTKQLTFGDYKLDAHSKHSPENYYEVSLLIFIILQDSEELIRSGIREDEEENDSDP